MTAGEGQLGEHVLLFRLRLSRTAVVNNVQGWFALENLVEGTEIVVQPFSWVYDINLWVAPYPWALLVRFIVPCGGA